MIAKWKIFAATLLTCSAAYYGYQKYVLSNSIEISVDLCGQQENSVAASAQTNNYEVEHAALLLEFYNSRNELIYNVFGPLTLTNSTEKGFSFEVNEAVCKTATSVVVSIDYELPIALQFTRNAKQKLVEATTVEFVASQIIAHKVQQFEF